MAGRKSLEKSPSPEQQRSQSPERIDRNRGGQEQSGQDIFRSQALERQATTEEKNIKPGDGRDRPTNRDSHQDAQYNPGREAAEKATVQDRSLRRSASAPDLMASITRAVQIRRDSQRQRPHEAPEPRTIESARDDASQSPSRKETDAREKTNDSSQSPSRKETNDSSQSPSREKTNDSSQSTLEKTYAEKLAKRQEAHEQEMIKSQEESDKRQMRAQALQAALQAFSDQLSAVGSRAASSSEIL